MTPIATAVQTSRETAAVIEEIKCRLNEESDTLDAIEAQMAKPGAEIARRSGEN